MEFPGEKLVLKMWETIAEKGIGSALQPWHEKRLGIAKNHVRRDEILMLAEAEKLAEDIRAGKTYPIENKLEFKSQNVVNNDRVEPILNLDDLAFKTTNIDMAESIRKDVNVSKSVLIAEKILLDEQQSTSEKDIEDDWLYSWRDYAGRVSASELQELWGRILAGEVKNPGSYSFRTMEFLKGLSKTEAELIGNLAPFIIAENIVRDKEQILEKEGITFGSLLFLQEIGVLSGVESLGLSIELTSNSNEKYIKYLISNNKVVLLEHKDPTKIPKLGIFQVTQIGRQVLALASFQSNEEYVVSIAKDMAKQGYSVKIADWKQETAESGRFFNPRVIEA
jgi:hypothetical protein